MSRELELLLFLWKWKLVSSTALYARFFPHLKPIGAYKALWRLSRQKLIHSHSLPANPNKKVWSLTTLGFKTVSEVLPVLKEEGFRSEFPNHDYWVTAIHLGDWLCQTPIGAELFSEQELRRMTIEDYLPWVPKTAVHRPDGYWRVALPQGQGTVALEVELKTKSIAQYSAVARFYRDNPQIFRIVWVVETLTKAYSLQTRLGFSEPGPHNFVLLKDFQRLGWNAPIQLGFESGQPLSKLLENRQENSRKTFSSFFLTTLSKYPAVLTACSQNANESKSALGRGITHNNPPPSTCFPTRPSSPTFQTNQEPRRKA